MSARFFESAGWNARCALTTLRNGAIERKGPQPADCCSTEDRKRTSRRRPNMTAKILTFSSHGDTTLLEYDPATADMKTFREGEPYDLPVAFTGSFLKS